MFSQSKEWEYSNIRSVITEGFDDNDLLLLLCSFILVFNCLLVWPTYEALQSLHEIL